MHCIYYRFGLNLPWRGRQTQCNHINNKIECETLTKIRKANTSTDFIRLIEHEHILHDPLGKRMVFVTYIVRCILFSIWTLIFNLYYTFLFCIYEDG